MSNTNSVTPFTGARLEDLNEAIGITQFPSEGNWYQTIGGLLIQGGLVEDVTHGAPFPVTFNVAFPLQVLGVFTQELGTNAHASSIDSVTLEQFSIILSSGPSKNFYWWAIGV